jgi:hypothetical protein
VRGVETVVVLVALATVVAAFAGRLQRGLDLELARLAEGER